MSHRESWFVIRRDEEDEETYYMEMHERAALGRLGRRAIGNRMFGSGGVVQARLYIYIYIYLCVCVCVCMYICVCVCMYIYIYV